MAMDVKEKILEALEQLGVIQKLEEDAEELAGRIVAGRGRLKEMQGELRAAGVVLDFLAPPAPVQTRL